MTAKLFNFDSLALIVSALILFISAVVGAYANNYLKGDKNRPIFLLKIFAITISLILTSCANNIFLMLISWMTSNLILVSMMIHKTSWKQSVNSGLLALKNFTIGFLSLGAALYLLSLKADSYLISEIIRSENISQKTLIISCALILIAALSQSAIYPFHSWLISSLNSPTPASAIMHAGLVNGGGILLARFAPLLIDTPEILTVAFVLGISSAILGTLWKMIQANVKAMLACSTMSQMGFMIAQCAMGLFPAAIAHLFWHGMFKAYLFLTSPSSWQERRLDLAYPPKISILISSMICGVLGALIFAKINSIKLSEFDTTVVLVAVCFIAASQVAITIINKSLIKNLVPALIISSAVSALYASSVTFLEKITTAEIFNPQPLNLFHIAAIAIFFTVWIARLFWPNSKTKNSAFVMKLYVKALNASQPKSSTITANRNQYNYR